ncbi:MAG: nitrophenyl compound nitroreductase subunit ArsF family protein [Bacteroidia bacterium]|nr:nitrophenyl compound nitroreductase subunit ArsF family protein [Bacteroidia bacterium]
MKIRNHLGTLVIIFVFAFISACHSGDTGKKSSNQTDTIKPEQKGTSAQASIKNTIPGKTGENSKTNSEEAKADLPVVFIYNFHVTNRCPTCIAIEEATTKTLNTYFSSELKLGRIKRQVLNVDDKVNNLISEKYQAFGSGLFVTRIFKGKETTTDLTGDGFKFAKNKEDKFIEILKSKISEYLK